MTVESPASEPRTMRVLLLLRADDRRFRLLEDPASGALRMPDVEVPSPPRPTRRWLPRALKPWHAGLRVAPRMFDLAYVGPVHTPCHRADVWGDLPPSPAGWRWCAVAEEDLGDRLIPEHRLVVADELATARRDAERALVARWSDPDWASSYGPRRCRAGDTPPLQLDWRLTGSGWGELVLCQGDRLVRFEASYLTDVLGELAAVATAIAWGCPRAACGFELEPGVRRLELIQEHALTVRLVTAADDYRRGGRVLFEGVTSARVFAVEVLDVLEALLTHHGADGYARRWYMHAFPHDLHAVLSSAVQDPPWRRRRTQEAWRAQQGLPRAFPPDSESA